MFGRVAGFEFLGWDDDVNITRNARLFPVTTEALGAYWTAPYLGLYVPVAYTYWSVLAVGSRAWNGAEPAAELDPALFHVGNLALHLGTVLFVLGILRRLGLSTRAAALGAALFALHPLQVEPVAWITESRGLLAALLSTAAIWLHLSAGANAAKPALWKVGALACFTLALLSKPSAAAAPCVLFVLERWQLGRSWRASIAATAPWFALAALSVVVAMSIQLGGDAGSLTELWTRPFIAADALAFYLGKLVLPLGLAAEYGRSPEYVLAGAAVWLVWLVPVALAAAVVFVPKLHPWRGATAAFGAGLIPVLGLIPFAYQQLSTVADRYAYLAMLGPALALGLWADARETRTRTLVPLALLLLWAGLSHRQLSHWSDTGALFEHSLAVQPDSATAHINYGAHLNQSGEFDAAEEQFAEAIRIRPRDKWAHYNLGLVFLRREEPARAAETFEYVLTLDPEFPQAHYNLGLLASKRQDAPAALTHFERAVEFRPQYAEAHNNLGFLKFALGDPAGAAAHFEAALHSMPGLVAAHLGLGRARASLGDSAAARASFERALALDPDLPEARAALQSLGGGRRP